MNTFIITRNSSFTRNHGVFGHVPDPPEPEEFECSGDCSRCKGAEMHADGRYICGGDEFEEREED